MEWSSRFDTGVETIDQQHRELFRRVGALQLAMHQGDRTEILRLLEFLRVYVVEHFGEEERVMRETAYPLSAHHRALHARFVESFAELEATFAAHGSTPWLSVRLHMTVTEWLKKHILGTDQHLGSYLLARSKGTAPRVSRRSRGGAKRPATHG